MIIPGLAELLKDLQLRACCNAREIAVMVQQCQAIFYSNGRYQTIDRFPYPAPSFGAGLEDSSCVNERGNTLWIVEREAEEILLYFIARLIVVDALQYLAQNYTRQTQIVFLLNELLKGLI